MSYKALKLGLALIVFSGISSTAVATDSCSVGIKVINSTESNTTDGYDLKIGSMEVYTFTRAIDQEAFYKKYDLSGSTYDTFNTSNKRGAYHKNLKYRASSSFLTVSPGEEESFFFYTGTNSNADNFPVTIRFEMKKGNGSVKAYTKRTTCNKSNAYTVRIN